MAKSEKEKSGHDGTQKMRKPSRNGEERHDDNENSKQSIEFSLLAEEKSVNPVLSSLFAPKPVETKLAPQKAPASILGTKDADFNKTTAEPNGRGTSAEDVDVVDKRDTPLRSEGNMTRKRKRKHDGEEIEDVYMRKLAREDAKEAEAAAKKRSERRERANEARDDNQGEDVYLEEITTESNDDQISSTDDEEESDNDANHTLSPPPLHETQQASTGELLKANRTVFLGNVSTSAISSKASRKILDVHLQSFFQELSKPKQGEPKYAIESLRFRSTPYATTVPKKAAFAKKDIMDATTKSTNAYAVYSSPLLAREAAKRLNGTVVLDRHLRVDEVAHPAKIDHRRCVFVGNLGFVNDESNIQAANAEEGKEKRKPAKTPADVEEGLWRTFGKCGKVESVRVIRDTTTRVGKGIAYVQFEDANAVEAALLYNEKKFPPMLPRKLRISRAKAQKRNAKTDSSKPSTSPKPSGGGYRRKISEKEASQMGRVSKLYGRAAAGQVKRASKDKPTSTKRQQLGKGIKGPEAFVFEGHRASSKSGNAGLRLGRKGKKGGKPARHGSKRAAAFKASRRTK